MKYLFYLIFFQTSLFSQVKGFYSSVEKPMLSIPQLKSKSAEEISDYIKSNFSNEELQIKAAYFHVISSVDYDVNYNFSTELFSSDEDFVSKTIANKKGVCIHYAKLLKAILNKLGYSCEIVTGYTKQNNQIGNLSHAWCAIKMKDNNWYLFDPTWDSGYVKEGKYTRNISFKYFKMLPSKAILTHMPFDYLWQFTKEPISNREFYNGKPYEGKPKLNFNYQTEIDKYFQLSDVDKAFESAERIKNNEIINDLILEQYNYLKSVFNTNRMNTNVTKFNEIVEEYNVAIVLLNDFIIYRNKEFTPSFSDAILSEMIQTPKERLEQVQKDFFNLGSIGKENAATHSSLKLSITETVKQAQEQYEFVKEYISKNKKERKKMFSVTTNWFGKPVK